MIRVIQIIGLALAVFSSALLAGLATGCTSTHYVREQNGEQVSFRHTALGTNKSLESAEYKHDADSKSFSLHGYKSEQQQAIEGAIRSAVEAALESANPAE